MIATILKNTDILHKEGVADGNFVQTYNRIKNQREEDYIHFVPHAFQTQVEGYFQPGGLDPIMTVQLFLEFTNDGIIPNTVLLEKLQILCMMRKLV
ncbi:MAG: hypothetical protein K2X98_04970 [Alphaproteobacteria bacterium]|nr:hypothetical protein [Alphaproteobacteria bacterium]